MAARFREGSVLVPLIREKTGHITVAARLGGRVARFIVDSGAGGTIIDSTAAHRYKLERRPQRRKGAGVGASAIAMETLTKHSLALGGVDLSGTTVHTMDLSHVNAGLKKAKVLPVVGIIGADVLWQREAVLDYGRSVMILASS